MAGTTPIYGFPYPESSDLVADYPALGQDLAEDVEAAIAAVPPGGLVHIATESFSAVSSVSLNGVFTSAYENYCLVLNILPSVTAEIQMRLRTAGTDNTASSYSYATYEVRSDNLGQVQLVGSADTRMRMYGAGDRGGNARIDVYSPQSTAYTSVSGTGSRVRSATPFATGYLIGAVFNNSTSFDGFTIVPLSGTMTGTVRVYGYANS